MAADTGDALGREIDNAVMILKAGLLRVSAQMLVEASGAGPADWLLLGRCAGRIEKKHTGFLRAAKSLEDLTRRRESVIHDLHTQLQAAYLYARRHSLVKPDDPRLARQLALLGEMEGFDEPSEAAIEEQAGDPGGEM